MRRIALALTLLAALASTAPVARAQKVLYQTFFDDGSGWSIQPCWSVDALPASVPGGPFRTAPSSLNCNNNDGGYSFCLDCEADSPPIDLGPAAGFGATLSFWCNYELEEDDCFVDTRHLQVSNDGFQTLLLDRCYLFVDCAPSGTWHEHQVALDPAWGIVQLRYFFDVHDFLFCNDCYDGWFVDDLAVAVECLPTVPYCTPKVNSLGCTPELSTTGAPSFSGASTLTVRADQVLSHQSGIVLWSLASATTPFGGGTLCLAPPVVRTNSQDSGGNPLPPDCSGSYLASFFWQYLGANGLTPGTVVHVQCWSRDPGFAGPDAIGLTAGVRFTVCP